MPPSLPTTDPGVERFLQTLRRSRLLTAAQLSSHLATLPAVSRDSAEGMANALVADGYLTHYQAEKLLRGRWQGLVLGPYHVLAPLGRGGMGTVYLARDSRSLEASASLEALSRLVALKVMPPRQAREEANSLARFRREMDLGRRLAHPNVTRTFDAGEIDGVHFIAMEYVPGESLRRLVNRVGPLPVVEAARLFTDVAAGLAHAHGRGLIHRDLKPSNVMVTPEGTAKILDLGLAILMDEELPANCRVVGGRGYILGTTDYMAPEQGANATDVGPWSDLYALGCSLYFTVTGAPPFPGGTAQQKLRWHRTEQAPPAESLNPDVPEEFARLIDSLLAKNPNDRPPSAERVQALLRPWCGEFRLGNVAEVRAAETEGEAVQIVDSPAYDPTLWVPDEPLDAVDDALAIQRSNHPLRVRAGMRFLWLIAILGVLGVLLFRNR